MLNSKLPLLFVFLSLAAAGQLSATPSANDITRVSVSSGGTESNATSDTPSVDSTGQLVTFTSTASNLVTSDNNGKADIFIHNRSDATTSLISKRSNGTGADAASETPAISADGNFVAFCSAATNLVSADSNGKNDIFRYSVADNTVERVSLNTLAGNANGDSKSPSISGTGRYSVKLGSVRTKSSKSVTVTVN